MIYVSLLRGINVGAHKRIKMDKLRQSFEALGFRQVKTFIQSGNVVFQTEKSAAIALSKKIEKKLLADFSFTISVVTRTLDEMNAVVAANPFLEKRGIDPERLHVMFLSKPLSPDSIHKLQELATLPDQCSCSGQEIYLYLPNGTADSLLMRKPLDRLLSIVTTTRNWRTVNSLHQMCKDCG